MNKSNPILKTAIREFKNFNSGIDFHWYHKNQTIFHCHDYFEISLIVKGSIIQKCNNKSDILSKGTLCILKPIDSHQYFPYKDDSISLLNFSITEETLFALCSSMSPSLYHNLVHHTPYTTQISDSVLNYILFEIKQLSVDETLNNDELNNTSIKSIIQSLLLQAYRHFTFTPTSEIPSWLTSFLLTINSPDYFNLPASQLYKLAPYSQTSLSAYMKQYIGKSLVEYIKIIKFNYAKNLLLNSDYSIEQIADKISYTNIHEYTGNILVIIAMSEIAKKYYQLFNIPEEIWAETMQDIKWKAEECKLVYDVWGTFVPDWYQGFFQLYRFGLGRLQFELIKFQQNYEYQGIELYPSDYVLSVHIPRTGTKLDKEQVDNSYQRAANFFHRIIRQDIVPFVCHSWLLAPQTVKLVSPHSNIYKFAADYQLFENGNDPDYSEIWRLYDKNYNGNFNDMPQDTALRKNYIEYFKQGGKFGYGYGIYFYQKV